jgi:primosomal protein N' (replication factor Y)
MKYFEVVPLTFIGEETEGLVYSSKNDLTSGQAVIINVRGKKMAGIVGKECPKPDFATKEIERVIDPEPVISATYLGIARYISAYYGSALTSVLQTMLPTGLAKKRRRIEAVSAEKPVKAAAPPLTADQDKVLSDIIKEKVNKPHLLFGVTGSGKTEVYLRLTEKALSEKRQAIILVPEVSLIPQTVGTFESRFPGKTTVYHSYLKETERFNNWQQIKNGEKEIIIGSRSALFAPAGNLGLIVIDEEHETSYKQDQNPRYLARHVAKKIADSTGARLVLGSATPSIESYACALAGKYHLHELKKRIKQDNLPQVTIVDMRDEFKKQNYSIFSEELQAEIKLTLEEKRQVMLFLNRRGMATFVNCRDCGYVAECPCCELPLTFHYHNLKLVCHHCGHSSGLPAVCPSCGGIAIKYFGSGTEKVELELKKLFGEKIRVGRMDRDTTQKRGSHETIFRSFAGKEVDILIGTQMITKGWDIPNVRLIGIVSADTMINFPDFSAAERTFNLLTQVAGRTGRGYLPGKVVLQTYSPDHPAIKAAKHHDYVSFYKQEMKIRKDLNYPPFAHLIKLVYNNSVQSYSEKAVCDLADAILKKHPGQTIIGPSPAFRPKVAGRYRWQIVLKISGKTETEFIKIVSELKKLTDNNWVVDVDPISTL